MVRASGKTGLAVLASLVLLAAGCGSGGGGTGGGGGGTGGGGSGGAANVKVPTTLPAGATLGCAEAPSSSCVYGGAASAPSGLKVVNINTKITPDMFKITDPFTIVSDKSAPGGKYIALPQGTGSTSQVNGDASVAVNIPQDGYYVIWAATQSGDTSTSTDSFFLGFDNNPPSADLDHAWSIKPDNAWHVHDSTGGCVQLVHQGPNDAPNGCDTWHFKKGILVIHIGGREDQSHLAWISVEPANPAQPLGDQRG